MLKLNTNKKKIQETLDENLNTPYVKVKLEPILFEYQKRVNLNTPYVKVKPISSALAILDAEI